MGWLEDLRRSGWAGDDAKKYQQQDDQMARIKAGQIPSAQQQTEAMSRRMKQQASPSPSPSQDND